MKVLITGGAGFIGYHLVKKLVGLGYEVVVLDNLSKQIHGENPERDSELYRGIIDKVTFMKGDVVSKEDWIKSMNGVEAIVHLAAETGTGQSMYEVERYSHVNIGGTAILLDLLVNANHQVKKVIIASSRAIYGEGRYLSGDHGFVYPDHRLASDMKNGDFEVKYQGAGGLQLQSTDEESKIHPSSFYGITKQVQEQMVMNICGSVNIPAVAFRYQNVYGPGQSLRNPYTGILSIFSNLILSGKDLNIFEDGLESRDFVFIDDVVDATILGLTSDEANGEIFNVGSGQGTSVIDVAKNLISNYGSQVEITISGDFRKGDIRHNYADLAKIKKKLGYQPTVTFEQGIQKFCNWVKTQKIVDNNYEQSLKEMRERGLMINK